MSKRTTKIVANICLYGNYTTGAGWLAQTHDGAILGNGEPKENRSRTEAVWQAADQLLRLFGACGGRPRKAIARVFAPGGERMATIDLRRPGYYGDMKWEPAVELEVSAADIEAAAC